jgi:hypothetical protein
MTEVVAYLDGVGIKNYEWRERYIRVLSKMDQAELSFLSKRLEQSRKK